MPIAAALGDPAGVGPELFARAWAARRERGLPRFFGVGCAQSVRRVWDGPVVDVSGPEEARERFDEGFPVWTICDSGNTELGVPSAEAAQCALQALEFGIGLARNGAARALVTGPVSKDQLYRVGFQHAGQTEFIADRCGIARSNAIMLLASDALKVVPLTVHVPLRQVPDLITQELVVARTQAAARGMERSFGIEQPRLALAGLNPHAGEAGALGTEEVEVLRPAVEQLRAEGYDVTGPHSPDAMFTPAARATYDAALCLYHDQGLIPLKALAFDEGVNVTLGLPIVRTSPDHGTAFDIAGKGVASPGPTIAAIRMAAQIVRSRQDAAASTGK